MNKFIDIFCNNYMKYDLNCKRNLSLISYKLSVEITAITIGYFTINILLVRMVIYLTNRKYV